MSKKMKLGMIGISDGNGHPYSWSAIFNGYDPEKMKDCGFPVIPEYLSQQHFPEDGLGHLASVTHIWTQDTLLSKKIAEASLIEHIVPSPIGMIGEVDAVLLARDDAENHREMALPFLKAGLPVFIDKPFALSVADAEAIWAAAQYPGQVYTCSALRYANELILNDADLAAIGDIVFVEASVMKKWDTYAIHIIEPVVSQLAGRGELIGVQKSGNKAVFQALVQWQNLSAYFKVTGDIAVPLEFTFFGERGSIRKTFKDSFSCFRTSLKTFIEVILGQKPNIDRSETLEMIKILEWGR